MICMDKQFFKTVLAAKSFFLLCKLAKYLASISGPTRTALRHWHVIGTFMISSLLLKIHDSEKA